MQTELTPADRERRIQEMLAPGGIAIINEETDEAALEIALAREIRGETRQEFIDAIRERQESISPFPTKKEETKYPTKWER